MDSPLVLANVTIESASHLSGFSRRIENMTLGRIFFAQLLYFISLFAVIFSFVLGPSYFDINEKQIPLSKVESENRLFEFSYLNISRLNRVLLFEMSLMKEPGINVSNSLVKVSTAVHSYSQDGLIIDLHQPLRDFTLKFEKNSPSSDSVRLFSSYLLNYDRLECSVVIKFADKQPLPVKFSWMLIDSAHTIIAIILRISFFIISLTAFFNLLKLKLLFNHSPGSTQLIFICLSTQIIASIPFSLFDLVLDTQLISFLESFLDQLFFIVCLYVGFTILSFGKYKNEPSDQFHLLRIFIPFLAAFALLFLHSYHTIKHVRTNSVLPIDYATKGLAMSEYVVMALYLPAIVLVCYSRDSESRIDQLIHSIMPPLLVISSAFTEAAGPAEAALGTNFAFQVFVFASCSVYSLFFSYYNWPVQGNELYEYWAAPNDYLQQ